MKKALIFLSSVLLLTSCCEKAPIRYGIHSSNFQKPVTSTQQCDLTSHFGTYKAIGYKGTNHPFTDTLLFKFYVKDSAIAIFTQQVDTNNMYVGWVSENTCNQKSFKCFLNLGGTYFTHNLYKTNDTLVDVLIDSDSNLLRSDTLGIKYYKKI